MSKITNRQRYDLNNVVVDYDFDIKVTSYYFAYGMNTDPQQMALRTGSPLAIGRAIVRNHAFRFAMHADVYPCQGIITNGVLWKINTNQLESLDIREGYPYYYQRKVVDVECDGKVYQAWMYFMTSDHVNYPPSDEYYRMLERGYTHFHVPLKQIIDGLNASKDALNANMPIGEYKKKRDIIAYRLH